MKQKISNRILSICNILVWIMFWSLSNLGRGIKVAFSVLSMYKQNEELLLYFKILFITLIILNLICIILNRKNRKLIIWYSVSIIFYIMNTLVFFEINILSDDFLSKAWCIVPAIILLINLIIEIIHKKRKKTIALYSLGIILCIIMFFINKYNDLIWLVIAAIMQFIYSKEAVSESKIEKIINIISSIILVFAIIYIATKFTIMLVKIYDIDKKSIEFINQIEVGLENENASKDNVLIKVCKNNKWGFINQKAEEIIPCEYDYIGSNLHATYEDNYLIARKGEVYYFLSKSGKILATNEETPVPFYNQAVIEQLLTSKPDNQNDEEYILELVHSYLNAFYIKNEYSTNIIQDDLNFDTCTLQPINSYRNDNSNEVYEYKLESGYELEIEEFKENFGIEYPYKYNIKVKKNNEVINAYENVEIKTDKYDNNTVIYTYTNGNVPYYNLEEKVQGYYRKGDFEEVTLKGNYEILDTIDDKILIRDYNDTTNLREMIMNIDGNLLINAKKINATENGYIIKKDNNKMIYLDKNLQEKTQEFDLINGDYEIIGLLICANNTNNGKEYVLCDLEGNILTNQSYQTIGEDYLFNENAYNKFYLLDDIYATYYGIY